MVGHSPECSGALDWKSSLYSSECLGVEIVGFSIERFPLREMTRRAAVVSELALERPVLSGTIRAGELAG